MNTPDAPKDESGKIQILPFSQSPRTEDESGRENNRMKKDTANSEDEEGDNGLSPGDLLSFAWQISKGMVCICVWCVKVIRTVKFQAPPTLTCILLLPFRLSSTLNKKSIVNAKETGSELETYDRINIIY